MESTPQQTSEGKAVVAVLAAVLERLVNSNAHLSHGNGDNVTKFHALKAPGISIQQYLERIHKYASCSTECFILALIYIDRLIQRNNFILSDLNVHRVVITAILLAAKFFDDAYYNNAYYAKVGGVLVSEMNGLEVEFLFRINFSLHVTPEVFDKYQDELVSHAIGAGLESPKLTTPRQDAFQQIQKVADPLEHQHHYARPQQHNNLTKPVVTTVHSQQLNDRGSTTVSRPQHEQHSQPSQNQCVNHHPQPQIQFQTQTQLEWMPNSSSNANLNCTAALAPKRHITPSPPHHQHPKQPIQENDVSAFNSNSASTSASSLTSSRHQHDFHRDQDTKMLSHLSSPSAKSAPGGLHNHTALSSQSRPIITARPRNNSFPTTCTTSYSPAGHGAGDETHHTSASAVPVPVDPSYMAQNPMTLDQFHGHGLVNMNTGMNMDLHMNNTINHHLAVPVPHQHTDSLQHFGHSLSPSTGVYH